MTRFTKTESGKYVVSGHSYEMLIGTRAQVWHGTACKTSGGLTKKDLMQNKAGRIISKSKYSTAKKEMRLVKAGYGSKKGRFGYVKLSGKTKKMRRGSRYHKKGGMVNRPLSPTFYDGKGVGTSGVALQFIAGQGN